MAPNLQELVVIGVNMEEIKEALGHPMIPFPLFESLKRLSLMNAELCL